MSASLGVPLMSPQEALGNAQQAFGLPPGLVYPPGLQNSVVNDGEYCSFSLVPERAATCIWRTERRAFLGRLSLLHQA
jgi:hypothetical protein